MTADRLSKKNKTMLDQVEEIKDNDLMDNLKSNEQLKIQKTKK